MAAKVTPSTPGAPSFFSADRLCKADEVLRGIELCLIRKPQGRVRLERQWCSGEHLGVEANPKRSLGFGHDLITPCWINRIGVGVLRPEVACDIELVYPLADLLNASSVRFGVAFCQVDIESFDQVPIDQPVLARDLCRRAAGHLASDPPRFEYSNR
jgi:hypothetical protein